MELRKRKRYLGVLLAAVMSVSQITPVIAGDVDFNISDEDKIMKMSLTEISVITNKVTTSSNSIKVNISEKPNGGIFKVIELDSDELYDKNEFFNYTSLSEIISFNNVVSGSNTFSLSGKPTEGKKLYVVYRNGTDEDVISNGIIIEAAENESSEDKITVDEKNITADLTEVNLSIAGFDEYKDGYLYVKQGTNSDPDSGTTLYSTKFTGEGSYKCTLRSSLIEGNYLNVYLYKYDANTDKTKYSDVISVKINAGQAVSTPEEILKNCSVEIVETSFETTSTSANVNVKLDKSLSDGCYLTIFAYAGNTAFDPDSSYNVRLWSQRVYDGDKKECIFNTSNLPLKDGYKVIACLNVPVGEDFYRSVNSKGVIIGEEFVDYTYPDAKIAETELEEGATKLHINVTGDERLFQAASEGKISITCAVCQYPEDEEFDFEGGYMVSLLSNKNITEPLDNFEVSFSNTPLRKGYRVKAIVYWSQNPDLFLAKGNDYESMFTSIDDSVIIKSKAAAVSASITEGRVRAGSTSVDVTVGGDIPKGSTLLIQRFPKNEEFSFGKNGEFIASSSDFSKDSTKVAVSSTNSAKLTTEYRVIAVILSEGKVIAQSEDVEIIPSSQLAPFTIEASGKVNAGASTVSLNVDYDNDIKTGTIFIAKADAAGNVDTEDIQSRIGQVSIQKGAVNIELKEGVILDEGDKIVPYIYYLMPGTDDFFKTEKGDVITVGAAVEGDSITISNKTVTDKTNSISVVINGYENFAGGRLIVAQGKKDDVDSATQIYSKQITTPTGTYECDLSGKTLVSGNKLLVYLYKYDSETDRTYYAKADSITIGSDSVEIIEPKVEIATTLIKEDSTSAWIITNFNKTADGELKVYSYTGDSFNESDASNKLLFSGKVTPSENSQKIDFNVSGLPLTSGNKIIATLAVAEKTVYSDSKTIQVKPQTEEPKVIINEKEITVGDTKMKVKVTFDKNSVSSAYYTAYVFEGEALNENADTTKVLSEGVAYNGSRELYFASSARPLMAGHTVVVKLNVQFENGTSKTYYSNEINISPSPDWGTPTVAIDTNSVAANANEVPLTVTYDDRYISMEDYYCTVTLYAYPETYSDEDFENNELHENSSIAKRIGSISSTIDNVVKGDVIIPINVSLPLPSDHRIIAKLRLPHTEWEGEEVDYLSYSVPIIGDGEEQLESKVLLFNLGEDTAKGSQIRSILKELNIPVYTIEQKQVNEKIGYLAGFDGFESVNNDYKGEKYKTEFMLMSSLSEADLDRILIKMRENGLRIDHKAIVTEFTKDISFVELIADIEDEHNTMQALIELGKMIKLSEKLKENSYSPEQWQPFSEALTAAKKIYSSYEPEIADIKLVYNNLKSQYSLLTGIKDITGDAEIVVTQNADDTYTLEASVKNSNATTFNYSWSNGEKGKTITGITKTQLEFIHVEITSDECLGMIEAYVKIADEIKLVDKDNVGITVSAEKTDAVPAGGYVKVELISGSTADNVIDKAENKLSTSRKKVSLKKASVLEIGVFDKAGKEIEPIGKLTFRLPIPKKLMKTSKSDISVIHMKNGHADEIKFSFDGDYIVFTTDELSKFIIAEKDTYKYSSSSSSSSHTISSTSSSNKKEKAEKKEENVSIEYPSTQVGTFTDVHTYDWFADSVKYVVERKIFSGISETEFAPYTAMTRAMLVSVLYRMEGEVESSGTGFIDVDDSQWYSKAVKWASSKGIVSGYEGGMFRPNDSITREQLASILYRYAGSPELVLGEIGALEKFSDIESVSPYAYNALSWAVSNGIISGTGNDLVSPQKAATRAEVASMLMRYADKIK